MKKRNKIVCSKGDNMFIIGALVNGLAIVVGTLMGKLAHRIPEKGKRDGDASDGFARLSRSVCKWALKSHQFLIVIFELSHWSGYW